MYPSAPMRQEAATFHSPYDGVDTTSCHGMNGEVISIDCTTRKSSTTRETEIVDANQNNRSQAVTSCLQARGWYIQRTK